MSSNIENYLGFPVGLSGGDLARRAVAQARRFGAEILSPMEAVSLRSQDGYHIVSLSGGASVISQALLVSTGVSYRLLDVPGADRLAGAGLFYGAALTEAIAVRDQVVLVVGGGNSAGQAAVYLARYARSVTILVRGKSLADTMSRYLIERLDEMQNVSVRTRVEVSELHGEQRLDAVSIHDSESGSTDTVAAGAVFVFIGAVPRTEWMAGALQLDGQGFILTGPDLQRARGTRPSAWTVSREPFWLETGVPGVFAAGDVRHRSTKRIASAVGEGAMAVQFVHQHLRGSVLAPRPLEPAGT
jgi:thioredoxin reductase (NADPH)